MTAMKYTIVTRKIFLNQANCLMGQAILFSKRKIRKSFNLHNTVSLYNWSVNCMEKCCEVNLGHGFWSKLLPKILCNMKIVLLYK